ncbi:MAG: FtsQ-type POTRA domain-containing protein [Hyphomicrobiaceae bacterium]|nr:FtsQ-type POTRA domain-containing protein [Hyphomicrobiaceae bacterium]
MPLGPIDPPEPFPASPPTFAPPAAVRHGAGGLAEPVGEQPRLPSTAAAPLPAEDPRNAGRAKLGDLRPGAPAERDAPALHVEIAGDPVMPRDAMPDPQPPARRRPRLGRDGLLGGRRSYLMAASLAGALAYALASGFGQNVRSVTPLSEQLDGALAKLGFGINEVSVTGHSRTLEGEVFRALGKLDRSLPGLDVAVARRQIEALPWVETAVLHRVWPDKLWIEIRERKPLAVWHDGERSVLVDRTGRQLAILGSRIPAELPRVSGPGAPDAAADLLAQIDVHPGLKASVAVAHRLGLRRWDLELANGTRIRLPVDGLADGLARLVRLDGEAALLAHPGRVIDLRLPDVVGIGPLSAVAPAAVSATTPVSASRPSRQL